MNSEVSVGSHPPPAAPSPVPPPPTGAGYRFPPQLRLKTPAEFQRVYDRKQAASDPWLVVYACENGRPHPRLGVAVSRKVGPAVVRNRLKRLYREAFRLLQHELPGGVDFVLIPRRPQNEPRNQPRSETRSQPSRTPKPPLPTRPTPAPIPTLHQVQQSLRRLARQAAAKLHDAKLHDTAGSRPVGPVLPGASLVPLSSVEAASNQPSPVEASPVQPSPVEADPGTSHPSAPGDLA